MASPPETDQFPGRMVPSYPSAPLLERALDLVFPPTCVGCRRIGRWVCEQCWPAVPWLPRVHCLRCGAVALERYCDGCQGRPSSVASSDAVTQFGGIAREAIHAMKFEGQHAISALMGRLLASRAVEGVTVVAPIPLHPARRRERGYDQCVMLARQTAKALDLPCEPALLRRVRRTRQQALLREPADRLANVMGAFEARMDVEGQVVLLIDDVTTSGATLEAAARPLVDRGAAAIHGLVFASARTRQDSEWAGLDQA